LPISSCLFGASKIHNEFAGDSMRCHAFVLVGCICILLVILGGCGEDTMVVAPMATITPTPSATLAPPPSGQPDLLPVPGAKGSFCRFDSDGNLAVTIKNQGSAAAGASTTSVKISGRFTSPLGSGAFGGTFTGMTPAISAGQSADVSVSVLATGGQILSASLTITADSTQQVAESSETNNMMQAKC
jgi:hypothetical protein